MCFDAWWKIPLEHLDAFFLCLCKIQFIPGGRLKKTPWMLIFSLNSLNERVSSSVLFMWWYKLFFILTLNLHLQIELFFSHDYEFGLGISACRLLSNPHYLNITACMLSLPHLSTRLVLPKQLSLVTCWGMNEGSLRMSGTGCWKQILWVPWVAEWDPTGMWGGWRLGFIMFPIFSIGWVAFGWVIYVKATPTIRMPGPKDVPWENCIIIAQSVLFI